MVDRAVVGLLVFLGVSGGVLGEGVTEGEKLFA